jgi:hypothetical protein
MDTGNEAARSGTTLWRLDPDTSRSGRERLHGSAAQVRKITGPYRVQLNTREPRTGGAACALWTLRPLGSSRPLLALGTSRSPWTLLSLRSLRPHHALRALRTLWSANAPSNGQLVLAALIVGIDHPQVALRIGARQHHAVFSRTCWALRCLVNSERGRGGKPHGRCRDGEKYAGRVTHMNVSRE